MDRPTATSAAPGTPEWNAAMDVRLRRYGSRAVRVWGYIGIGIVVVAVSLAFGKIWDALSVLFVGAIMAFIYAPIVNFLDRRFHVPRLLATLIGLLTLAVVVLLLLVAMLPPITDQVVALAKAIPGYVGDVQKTWDSLVAYFDRLDPAVRDQISSMLVDFGQSVERIGGALVSSIGDGLVRGVSGTVSMFVSLSMAVVVSFWLAKDFPRIERELSTIAGPRAGKDYSIVTSVFGRSLGGYLKGLVITSSCTGLIAGIGYWVLGVPYSGLLGLTTAVLNVIPYIGPWVGGGLAFIVGLTVGWGPAILSIIITVCAQQFTDSFVSPKVMQSAVSLHPALVIIALVAGGSIGGIVGMILAVPLTAAIKGVFVYYFEKKTGRQLVSKDGAIFKGEQFCDAEGNPRPACDALGVDIQGDKGVPPRVREEVARERAEQTAPTGGNPTSEPPAGETVRPDLSEKGR